MSSPSQCPSCNIAWEEEETITEHFERKGYTLRKALQTGAMYGCTPDTPKHFGKNVIGIAVRGKYDGVSYWKCTVCEVVHDRWTLQPIDEKFDNKKRANKNV